MLAESFNFIKHVAPISEYLLKKHFNKTHLDHGWSLNWLFWGNINFNLIISPPKKACF